VAGTVFARSEYAPGAWVNDSGRRAGESRGPGEIMMAARARSGADRPGRGPRRRWGQQIEWDLPEGILKDREEKIVQGYMLRCSRIASRKARPRVGALEWFIGFICGGAADVRRFRYRDHPAADALLTAPYALTNLVGSRDTEEGAFLRPGTR